MSASTQPPPTVPMNEPSSKTTILAPTCCGVEPLVLTTVAIAAARAPSSRRLYISRKISADDNGVPNDIRMLDGSAIRDCLRSCAFIIHSAGEHEQVVKSGGHLESRRLARRSCACVS